ncbi:MAG TPA: YHS domain-containing (seleno)protein [Alphaproteobacteria bacterium]
MPALLRLFALVVFVVFAAGAARAEKPEIFAANGVAIGGYDPVAYFTEQKPVKGSAQFSFEWKGAAWHFASAANRDAFKADPAKYAPQYGGYCAFGASEGYTVKTEPDAWSIVDGKLYLNYNTTVRTKWSVNMPGRIKAADKNWPEILKK